MDRWLFPIRGRAEDVAVLREQLRTGPRRLEDFHDEHGAHACLCDRRIELNLSGVHALDAAEASLERINDVLSWQLGESYEPVVLAGAVYEGLPDGTRRARPIAVTRIRGKCGGRMALSAPDPTILVGGVPIASRLEQHLAAEEIEPLLRGARRLAQGSIADVCRAYETVKRGCVPGNRSTRAGFEYMRDAGWMTPEECENMYATWAKERHALQAAPPTQGSVLPLPQARALVQRLLDRWAEELTTAAR
jgi:hypothetical protein